MSLIAFSRSVLEDSLCKGGLGENNQTKGRWPVHHPKNAAVQSVFSQFYLGPSGK